MIISITTPDNNTTDIYLDKVALCIRNPVARVITFKMLNHDNIENKFDTDEGYNTVLQQLAEYYNACNEPFLTCPDNMSLVGGAGGKVLENTVPFSSRENGPILDTNGLEYGPYDVDFSPGPPKPKRDLSQGTGGL